MKSFFCKTVAIVIMLVLTLALSSLPASAIEVGGIGIIPANPDPAKPLTVSWFIYEFNPGATIKDAVLLRNNRNEELKVKLEAVDGNIASDGTFGLLDAKSSSDHDIASWTKLETTELTLKPLSKVTVPFTITIPKDAEVVDHIGGLVVYRTDDRPDQVARAGGAQVNIYTRVGARTYLTVLGDITRGFKLMNRYFYGSDKKIVFRFRAKDTGNVRNALEADIKIYNLFGLFDEQEKMEIGQIMPGKVLSTRVVWPGKDRPLFGPYLAIMKVRDAYEPLNHNVITATPPKEITTWVVTFFIPYIETIIFVLLLFLAWFIYQFVIWQRLITLARQPLITYKIKKGDHLVDIASHRHVPWKLVAKINDIRPPYGLGAIKQIYIPDAKGVKMTDIAIPSFFTFVSRPFEKLRFRKRNYYTIVIERGDKKKDVEKFTKMTWVAISKYNGLSPSFRLTTGRELKIPRNKK